MEEGLRLYKQLKKQEKKYETAGPAEKKRIMRKCLALKKHFDAVVGKSSAAQSTVPEFQNAGVNEDGDIVHNVHPDVKD